MLLLEWLADLVLSLLGGLVGEQVRQRRAAELTRKRIAAFNAGETVRIRCALHHVRDDTSPWRHGSLRLRKGAAAWVPRFHRRPDVTFDRATAVAHESFNLNRRLMVLSYRIADDVVELGVRRRDLVLVGRVVELPPTSM